MSVSSLAARSCAHGAAESSVRCQLCPAEAEAPGDIGLHGEVAVLSDAIRGDLYWGRDHNGWLVVSLDSVGLCYCDAHNPRRCLRHAAARFGLALPEGLR